MRTPCNAICEIKDGVCIGCGRTQTEVAQWARMTDDQRNQIMARLGYEPHGPFEDETEKTP